MHMRSPSREFGSDFGAMLNFLFTALIVFSTLPAVAQLAIPDTSASYTITFDSTLSGVNNGAFAGSGFQSSPTSGQLDSDAWAVTGWSNGNLSFGGTQTTASTDYTRGIDDGVVTTGGFYGFDVDATAGTDRTLGLQLGNGDFAPGTLTLRLQNTSGSTITDFDFDYELWVINDQGRSSSFNPSHSSDNSSYTNLSSLNYTSGTTSTGTSWVLNSMSTTISGLTWANNDYYYLRWSSDDIGGSGSRDEFGLDDISLSNFLTGASGGGSIFDTNDATAGSGATVGSYNWSDANWSASAAGTDTTGNYSAGVATFAAGTDATGAITMNVDTAVSASGLSFEEGAFTIANASGGTLTLTGSATATVASGLTAAVSQAIGGTAGLTKAGAGTFNLSGANIYTGATAVNEGELGVSGGDAIPNSSAVTLANVAGAQIKLSAAETIASLAGGGASGGNVNLQGHTLTLTGSSNTSFAGVISGASGSLVKNGSANQTLTGDNSFTGLTDVQAGTLTLNRSGGAIADGAPVQISGGTLAVTQSDTVGAVTLVSGTISGAGTLTGSSFAVQSGTISAPLAGSGALTKSTAGTVTLSGANTFTGATNISAGTLALTGGGVLSSSSGINMTGGTFDISGISSSATTIASLVGSSGAVVRIGTKTLTVGDGSLTTFAGALESTTGGLTKAGAGTFNITQSNPGYGGGSSVTAGTLSLGASNALGSAGQIAVTGEATLLAGSGTTQANPLTLNYVPGALTVLAYWNFNALNISTASAPGSGGVPLTISADSGAGTLSLAGFTGTVDDFAGTTVNNYLGAVAGKSLSLIGPAGNDSHLQISGLDFTGYTNPAVTMATQDSGAGYDTNQWSYSVDGAAFNNAGSVISPAGSYSVRTSGTIPALDGTPSAWLRYTVAGASSALGNNRIDNVQVTAYAAGEAPSVGIDSAGTASFTGAITLNGEAVFTAATSGTAIFSGNIVDGGSAGVITKTGGGTVQLTGNNSYTGATRINAGTLSAAGTGIGDFSAVILSDVAGAQLVLTGNEQVGSLSGGGASGGNVNMGANVFTIGNDNTSTTFAGVLSGTGGILNKRGSGTFNLTGGNTFTGGVVVNNGTMVVPSVALDGVPQALGAGGPVTMQNNAALVITGGGDMDRNLVLSGSSATLSVGTTVNFAGTISNAGNSSLIKTGAGTFNLTGSGDWNGDNYVVEGALAVTGAGGINGNNIGAGSITVSAGAALNIDTSGQVRASGVTALTGAVVRMDAGTLRTNSVTMNGSGTFNWQGGTLQAYSQAVLGSGSDVSGSGGSLVYSGREILVTGNLTTGADTILDLGDLYIAGTTVYDFITVTGILNLGAADDTLRLFASPYLLRSGSGGALFDYGTIPLVTATGGITGVFDHILAPLADNRPFNLYGGSWPLSGNPANLPVDTYYIEQTANQILLHYHVSAAIPEPATGALVLAGVLGLRIAGVSRRRRAAGEGAAGPVSLRRWARSARRKFNRSR